MRDGYGSQDSSTDVSDSDDDVDFNEEGEAEESARGGVPEDLHRLLKKSGEPAFL